MGIYSRDYIRESPPAGGFSRPGHLWAVKYLLIANIVFFLLQKGSPSANLAALQDLGLDLFPGQELPTVVEKWALLWPEVWYQPWRFVTYGFCHATIEHIAVNMFVFWMFGRVVEPIYGSKEFLAFFLAGVIFSGFCHLALVPESGILLGASGGVMAVVFLTAMIYPRMTVLLFFVIPMPLWLLAILYAVVDVSGALSDGSNVAHWAHLGGAAFGVGYKYFQWRVLNWFSWLPAGGMRVPKRRPSLRVYRPSSDKLDDQVDRILAKIHEEGEESLTEREREILKQASQRYKKR